MSHGDASSTRPPECTAGALFSAVWDALVDVLGSAATSALVQRSVRCAASRHPELLELRVVREGFDYRYVLPSSWSEAGSESLAALRGLTSELGVVLTQTTGPVVTRRLAAIPSLRDCAISFDGEAP
jgi:hypothetical protein